MKKFAIAVALICSLALTACGSNADTASDNISKEAEKFKVARKIVVYNNITDKVIWSIEGRCSFEVESEKRIMVICKDGPGKYTKATVGLGDNATWVSAQLGYINVSEYRTKIILRPEALIPDFDLVTGRQDTPR